MKVKNCLLKIFSIVLCFSFAISLSLILSANKVIAETGQVLSVSDLNFDFETAIDHNVWGESCVFISKSGYAKINTNEYTGTLNTVKKVAFEKGTYILNIDVIQSHTASIGVSLTDSEDNPDIIFDDKDVSSFNIENNPVSWTINIPSNSDYNVQIEFKRSTTENFYFDNIELYKLEESGSENEENIVTEDVVYIRTTINSKGLRFQGRVDKEYFETLCENKQNVKTGMMIAPTDYIEGIDFTVSDLDAAGKSYLLIEAETFYNQNTIETDGYYAFYCSIKDLIPFNVDRNFSARSFVSYTENDETEYVYGAYDKSLHPKNAYEITAQALNEGGLDEATEAAFLSYQNVIGLFNGSILEQNGNEYVVKYVVDRAGYFTLKTNDNKFTVISLNGNTEAYLNGYVELNAGAELTFVITVNGDFINFPVFGKIYYK